MLFNSLPFLFFFLPLVLAMVLPLRGNRLLRAICLSSLVFYGCAGQAWFLIPMAITIVADFWISQLLYRAQGRKRKAWLCLSLCSNLGLLAYFKYAGLFLHSAQVLATWWDLGGTAIGTWTEIFRVTMPAGISFYTFQTVSYVIDVYRGKIEPEKNFYAFVAFVSFFPHLVAGPLTRHHQLIPALKRISETGITPRWRAGIYLFAVGLCKKILIADRLAVFVDPCLAAPSKITLISGWLALIAFTFQIYFDFSGYSDMAIGLGRLFDVELPQNFNRPYSALNPGDFWRRWHITLSEWLRDYLYIPLGGNRCSPHRRDLNLLITMTLGGLWHGASWTFAIWGLYHGCLLIGSTRARPWWNRMPAPAQQGLTFALVTLGWLPFRARAFGVASQWSAGLLGLHGSGWLQWDPSWGSAMLLLIAAGSLAQLAPNESQWTGWDTLGKVPQFLLAVFSAAAVLLINFSSRFLYFQF